MKIKTLKSVITSLVFILFSCQDTVVTNIVHPDGSVTRRIVIKDPDGKDFKQDEYCVPFDDTWLITDTFELNEKGDTTWVRKAEKLFKNVEEINKAYSNDSGPNQDFEREAKFSKKFQWFSTLYRFSENIDKTFKYGYPIDQYLNKQELEYYYMPENLLTDRLNGADSTFVKQIEDSVKIKSDKWITMCLISEWKEEFLRLSEKSGRSEVNRELLKEKDSLIYSLTETTYKDTTSSNFDSSLVSVMKNVFGEKMYFANKVELDSSVKIVEERFESANSFRGYSVRTLMPGEMVATNGFNDQNGEILWQVKMEYFLTQPCQMWAESKTTNIWAWAVSGIFVVFVIVGLVVRSITKKNTYRRR